LDDVAKHPPGPASSVLPKTSGLVRASMRMLVATSSSFAIVLSRSFAGAQGADRKHTHMLVRWPLLL